MTSDSKAPAMTLWGRVERWPHEDMRGLAMEKPTVERPCNISCRRCQLEADLRELMAVVERVPHIHRAAGIGETIDADIIAACARCALEARIGGAK